MTEVKKSLKCLAIYALLLAGDIPFYAELLPPGFPFSNLSSLYLLSLAACLMLRYYLRVAEQGRVKKLMLGLAGMIALLLFLRGVKYMVFPPGSVLARYTWYFYYIPILLIPLFLFEVFLSLFAKEGERDRRLRIPAAAVTAVLILLVLTNDLHGQVFRFQPGFADWDREYSYGPGYFAVTVWQYGLYAAAVLILTVKSAITKIKKRVWGIPVSFVPGIALQLLLITGRMPKVNGMDPVGFPELLCFMAAAVLECCMQLGLIPTNESYGRLMSLPLIPVQITDRAGTCIYRSAAAEELTAEQFALPDNTRIGPHTVLRRMEIPGGFGFWQKDMTEPDRLAEEMEDTKTRLSEESELLRLQIELRQKEKKVEQRTAVYDDIAKAVREQSAAISRLAREAGDTGDRARRERCCRQITLLGACIKRCANLALLSLESPEISAGELGLSVAEVLRYLNRCGIPGELVNTAEGPIPADQAAVTFQVFSALLQEELPRLLGLCAVLSSTETGFVFKLTLEGGRAALPEALRERAEAAGIRTTSEQEEDTGYLSFLLSKGGGAL